MFRLISIVSILAFTPMAAAAMGCGGAHGQQAMTCVDGHIWDDENQKCVPLITG